MSNYPDGTYAAVMAETAGHNCPTEDGRVFFCPDPEYAWYGHYFTTEWPVKRGDNWCHDHNWPCRRVDACVCDEL